MLKRRRLPKSDLPGIASVCPDCPRCGNTLVWRGSWECDACPARVTVSEYSGRGAVVIVRDGIPEQSVRGLVELPRGIDPSVARGVPLFSSSEETNCASRRADWIQWLEGVEAYTSPWRRRRAARFRLRAAVSHWHREREVGQGRRFERIARCGEVVWELCRHTPDGTSVRPLRASCGCWRLCARCLGARRHKLQTGVESRRAEVVGSLTGAGGPMSRRYVGAEGRWSEKMLTFTVSHSGSASADARTLTRAWRDVSRRIADHLRTDRGMEKGRKPVWVRALEVAPSEDGGHAHLHVWWVGPFLDHAWLRVMWGRVLQSMGVDVPSRSWGEACASAVDARFRVWARTRRGACGREPDSVPWPVVSLNADRSGATSAYAQKVGVATYVLKAGGGRERLSEIHAALVYEALESARCVQWARGWAPVRQRQPGVTWSLRLAATDRSAQNEWLRSTNFVWKSAMPSVVTGVAMVEPVPWIQLCLTL